MLKVSSNANPNYLAKVVKLPPVRKHTNADRLGCVSIDGNNVITSLDAKEGELYIYFPVESVIDKEFLAWSNSFEDKELNQDKDKKGFFDNKCRVRAIRLRGEKSEGYIVPFLTFMTWLGETVDDLAFLHGKLDIKQEHSNYYFDSWNDRVLVTKYVVKRNEPSMKARKDKKVRTYRLVEDQFRLHVDTEQFKRYTDRIKPSDIISVTYKLHGTSFVVGKVLCNRSLKWYEKILKKVGVKIETSYYDTIYASRKVVKNAYDEGYEPNHFYGYDLWEDIAKSLEEKLTPGVTLYGEAVGYTKDGGYIQKPYDYGCTPGEFKTYIYRITFTNPIGKVFEFSTQQVREYCLNHGLNYVPELYYGRADGLTSHFNPSSSKEELLEELSYLYLEKDCYMCRCKVPAEGIVIRREVFDIEAYKLKSFKFLEFETKQLDTGETGLEE